MAYYSKKDSFLYVSGYNLSPVMETIGAKMTSAVDSWRGLGTTASTRTLTGEKDAELTLAGLYDDASTAVVGAKPDSTDRVWIAGFETDALNQRCWCFGAAQVSEGEIVLEDEKMNRIQPVISVNGTVNEGYIVAPLAARTTSGNTQSTYGDMGAGAGIGVARAFLIVTSITLGGYDSVTITPQSSPDHSSWNDETAFATVSATGGQAITLASAVDRYLAVKWAWVGAGTGQSVTFWVGVSRD